MYNIDDGISGLFKLDELIGVPRYIGYWIGETSLDKTSQQVSLYVDNKYVTSYIRSRKRVTDEWGVWVQIKD